jgi:hypothetical protein
MSRTPTLNIYLFEGPILLGVEVSLFVISPDIEDRDEVE